MTGAYCDICKENEILASFVHFHIQMLQLYNFLKKMSQEYNEFLWKQIDANLDEKSYFKFSD